MTRGQPPRTGPTALRMLLGSQLRSRREAASISRQDAGDHIRASESKISRMELGRVKLKLRDVADLLTLYGVLDPGERQSLLRLVRQSRLPGWWEQYGDVLPHWFATYIGLEEAAVRIRTYQLQFVPGLLQTTDYARAVIAGGQPELSDDEVEMRLKVRMERQHILDRADPPQVWAVIDEGVLHRPIGGPAVLRDQLRHLAAMARRPNVVVQVIPFGHGGHAADGGAFTILRFAVPELPDIVYVEQLTSALYVDKREDVERYTSAMDRLAVSADPPGAIDLIERAADSVAEDSVAEDSLAADTLAEDTSAGD